MRTTVLVGVALGACSLGAPAHLQAQAGEPAEAGFPFGPWYASVEAAGGAGAAATGTEFILLNPAAAVRGRGVHLGMRAIPAGARDMAVAVGHSVAGTAVALTLKRRQWDDIAADLGLPDLSAYEQEIAATLARPLSGEHLRAGVSIGRLDVSYLGHRASAWAFDAGAQGRTWPGMSWGVSLLHAGGPLEGTGSGAPLPMRIRAGVEAAHEIARLEVSGLLDIVVPARTRDGSDLHVGVGLARESGPVHIGLRAGWRRLAIAGQNARRSQWSAGGSAALRRLRLDLALSEGGDLGSTTIVGAALLW